MFVHANAKVEITYTLTLTEDVADALAAISGWAPKDFVKALSSVAGSAVREKQLLAFFMAIRTDLEPAVRAFHEAEYVMRKDAEKRIADAQAARAISQAQIPAQSTDQKK